MTISLDTGIAKIYRGSTYGGDVHEFVLKITENSPYDEDVLYSLLDGEEYELDEVSDLRPLVMVELDHAQRMLRICEMSTGIEHGQMTTSDLINDLRAEIQVAEETPELGTA